jgi:8-oxo-dGTP diphosphatase
MSNTYKYPRPSVTTDCVIFLLENSNLKVLLIKRGSDPFKGKYALPGGYLDIDEEPEQGALRELEEETGLKLKKLFQIGAFGKVDRDPRGRTISIAHFFLILESPKELAASSDADDLGWFSIKSIPDLAFDHYEIILAAIRLLKTNLKLSQSQEKSFGLEEKETEKILFLIGDENH